MQIARQAIASTVEFEQSMRQMAAIVNTASGSVEELGQVVMAMGRAGVDVRSDEAPGMTLAELLGEIDAELEELPTTITDNG